MLLPKIMSSFKAESQGGGKSSSANHGGGRHVSSKDQRTTMDVGLRLLPQITNSKTKTNVLMKSSMKKLGNETNPLDFCFLKTCNLCNKKLSPDKDIYMYRGDQGFCSIVCRNRQIALDEVRELENSTKQMVASYRHCWNDARLETRLILEDLQMQRLKSKPLPRNQNHWAVVS